MAKTLGKASYEYHAGLSKRALLAYLKNALVHNVEEGAHHTRNDRDEHNERELLKPFPVIQFSNSLEGQYTVLPPAWKALSLLMVGDQVS